MATKREKRIGWVLEFISLDLERMMRSGGLRKAIVDLGENLGLFGLDHRNEELERVQAALQDYFITYIEPVLVKPNTQSLPLPRRKNRTRYFFSSRDELHLQDFTGGKDAGTQAIEQLTRLVGADPPLPTAAFQTCEECRRWFFSPRVKRFCDPRCNWKANTRKRRGADGSEKRKAYNTRQKQVMKDRYRKAAGHPPLKKG